MLKHFSLLFLFASLSFYNLQAQSTSRQIRNLEAFTRLYGFVQYFHPADEAPRDWALVAIYGSQQMLKVKDDTELVSVLKSIFIPIAPTVKVFLNSSPEHFSIQELTPENPEGYQTISWQHIGFELPMFKNGTYWSRRLNRNTVTEPGAPTPQVPLLNRHTTVGEYLQQEITDGLSCIVPYALYGNALQTFPKADPIANQQLTTAMNAGLPKNPEGKLQLTGDVTEIRLANIIITWNIFKHSFPYWEDASVSAQKILTAAFTKAIADQTGHDFLNTLKLMCAPLNDGHMFIELSDGSDHSNEASAPLILSRIAGKVLVKEVLDSTLNKLITRGDIIDSIAHISAAEALSGKERYLSGSSQWKEAKGLVTLLNGPENTAISLVLDRKGTKKSLILARNVKGTGYRNGSFTKNPVKRGWVKPGVFYLNLSTDTISEQQYEKELATAKAVIFDLRGYPASDNAFNLIPHLLTQTVNPQTFFTPEIIYPDLQQVTYEKDPTELVPAAPHLKARIYFLVDATAQSASETLLSRMKDFKLATLIGQPTSGTNGSMNVIYLPGHYSVAYTGMLVKNNDGSKHHLKGIIPDIIVNPTVQGISSGRDEILEAALKMAVK